MVWMWGTRWKLDVKKCCFDVNTERECCCYANITARAMNYWNDSRNVRPFFSCMCVCVRCGNPPILIKLLTLSAITRAIFNALVFQPVCKVFLRESFFLLCKKKGKTSIKFAGLQKYTGREYKKNSSDTQILHSNTKRERKLLLPKHKFTLIRKWEANAKQDERKKESILLSYPYIHTRSRSDIHVQTLDTYLSRAWVYVLL